MNGSHLLIMDTHIWIWWVKQDIQLPAEIEKRLTEHPGALAISSRWIVSSWLLQSITTHCWRASTRNFPPMKH